jgi:hypothetical protein
MPNTVPAEFRRQLPALVQHSSLDTLFSKRFETPGLGGQDNHLEVRLARSETDRLLAQDLINRRYDWRGYGDQHSIPTTPGHATFLACLDSLPVGTITLAVDIHDGLATDRTFRDELNMFRRIPGASLCELTKFAFDSDLPSRKLLASLFHIVFIYGMRHHRCTHLFIEVSPRHRRFYEAMLGFQPIGEVKTNSSVQTASQLMWLKVSDIASHIAAQAGRAATSRSLYPLFLNGGDERSVHSRLLQAVPRPTSFDTPLLRN